MLKNVNRVSLLGIIVVLSLILVPATYASPELQTTGISINEIRIDQPSTDIDEYFELAGPAGASLNGLTYLVIGDGATGSGTIEAVVDLGGQAIPGSGYFVAAEGTFSLGTADLTTSLNFENSDNVTHALVSGFSGANGDDLDTDDDGILDSTPWTELIDSVALVETVGSGDQVYGPIQVGPDGSYVPAHVYYCSGGWEIGAYDPVGGDDTPGSANECEIPLPEVKISEIRIDQPSTDNDEYFELAGATGTALDGLTYLVIGDGSTGSGTVEAVVDLTGQAIPGSGYFVAAEGTFSLGTADLTTSLNFENSDNVTHVLVYGFSGADGDDLDTDDDGILDSTPWTELIDSVALVETVGSGDQVYGPIQVGPDGSFVPAHVYYCSGGWEIGAYDPVGGDDTPGAANVCEVALPDVKINEIRIDQPSTDNDEYFELAGAAGTSLDGLTYLVIGDGSTGSGTVEAVVDLTGQAIPGSGYFVAAEGTFSLGTADLTTSLNFENSDNVTHVLVYGFTGSNGDDLDTDDNGTLDVLPWVEELDRIALVEDDNPPSSTEYHYGPPSVGPDGSFVPGHIFLCEDSWRIGEFGGGEDTPGGFNACAPDVHINEIRIDQPSTDNDEYFELAGDAGTALDGLTYLVIGDGTGGSGVIEAVVELSGQSVPSSEYFVAAESSFSLGTADLVTSLNFENSDNVTHLLVFNFSGSNGEDLDTDDDGVLDFTPWAQVVDAVALVESPGSGDLIYSETSVGPDGSYVPGHIYLCTDGWRIGAFDPEDESDTAGEANFCPAAECEDPYTPVFAIQGSANSSPLLGLEVTTEGIVVGDFQDGLSGFYIQDPGGDGDPGTSDGVFVYSTMLDVSVGDEVRVTGTVDEYFDLTEVTSVSQLFVCSSGNEVEPTAVELPVDSVDDFEIYEGMLVTFPQSLSIAEYFNFDRYGEIVLSLGRQFQPTAIHEPGSSEAGDLAAENLLSRIKVDDGRTNQNPDPAIHPNGLEFTLGNRFRGGDLVQNLTGVMDFNFGEYKVQPTEGAQYTPINPRPSQPDPVGGDLKVAAFNVLNYFTTFGSRGADDQEEFDRQRDKIFSALAEIDADIVGLVEIENNGTAVADLVDGLNQVVGEGTYAYVDTGVIGPDEIAVALIYKPAKVAPLGDHAVLDTDNFLDPNGIGDPKNRPALAQTFRDLDNAGIFTAVVNHFKSKGSECGAGDDDPEQGSCNVTRTLAAEVLLDWLAGDPTGSGDNDFLVIGDINSYDHEDPIDVFRDYNYTDLILEYLGENAYTYVFDGQLGYLDYALSNAALLDEVSGTTVWNINADEPDILDYDTTYKQDAQDALYEPNAFRSSDHDPVIVGLELESDNQSPVCDTALPSVDMLWPVNHKFIAVELLEVTDPDGDPFSITIESIFQDEPVDDGGDGSTAPDAIIYEDGTFELRAERTGDGNGRVYTITFTATDYYGDSCQSTVVVGVPHDQGKKADPPVDDGALYDSTQVPEPTPEAEASEAVIEQEAEVAEEPTEEPTEEATSEPTEEPTAEPDAAVTPEPPAASNGNGKKDK